MYNFVLVGLNHRTAKVDVRQLAAFNEDQLADGLKRLSARPGILEAMILSTCNRVEILSSVERRSEGIESLEAFLSEYSRIAPPQLGPILYRHTDDQAVRHVFRVASSLDSMILGESQILGQVKSCYSAAVEAGTLGTYLNSLLQAAFRAAKRVRSETSIGEYPVSVSSAAIELVRKIFGDLRKKSILIIGAGKMGEAAVRYLTDIGAKNIYLANRSPETARELAARFNGLAVAFTELEEWISRSDIIFTSTGASDTLVDHPMVQRVMQRRKNSPVAFIDISVPRNVDPAIGTIDNVFCYDIDDLEAVVEANLGERIKAAAAAEKILDHEVQAFCARVKSSEVAPAVIQVQNRIDDICRTELQRSLRKIGLQEPRQLQELESMISRIASKIAHPLIMQLKSGQDPPTAEAYRDLIQRLFKPTKDSE
jgi:glutamyl-tRNA reductase